MDWFFVKTMFTDRDLVNTSFFHSTGCPAWIRTRTKASKGPCATVTPPDMPRGNITFPPPRRKENPNPSIAVAGENVFNPQFEQPRHLERQRQTRIVLLRLDRVHRLARDAKLVRQIALRPVLGRAQFSKAVFHR